MTLTHVAGDLIDFEGTHYGEQFGSTGRVHCRHRQAPPCRRAPPWGAAATALLSTPPTALPANPTSNLPRSLHMQLRTNATA
jgi:hypothetical protein